MSEFKFACPVCGQHITCDSGSSGTQMNCPTCFRDLVVPQPPAAGSPNMVLSASEVHKRTIPLPGNGGTVATTTVPAKNFPVVAVVLVAFVLCAVAGTVMLIRTKSSKPQDQQTNNTGKTDDDNDSASTTNKTAAVKISLPPPSADATNWTLNLDEAVTPDASVSGNLIGHGFTLERATIQGGHLDLRQGSKWPPDLGVSVHLFAEQAEDLAGKTVAIDSSRTPAPKIIIRWKNEQGKTMNKEYKTGYVLRVEFGQVSGKRLPGKIYVAVPDDEKSYAAGTFVAEIRKPSAPKKSPAR